MTSNLVTLGTGDTVLGFRDESEVFHYEALQISSLNPPQNSATPVFTRLSSLRLPKIFSASVNVKRLGDAHNIWTHFRHRATAPRPALTRLLLPKNIKPTPSSFSSLPSFKWKTCVVLPVHNVLATLRRARRQAANALFEKEKEERLERARRKRRAEEAKTAEAAAPRGRKVTRDMVFVWALSYWFPSLGSYLGSFDLLRAAG